MAQKDVYNVFDGMGVSSSVSTNPGYFDFSRIENHSLWFVMWFKAPESTYHTSFVFEVFIESNQLCAS